MVKCLCFYFLSCLFASKIFQAQKAKEKEENEKFVEELDRKFTSLVQSEAVVSLTEPSKMNALKALVNKSVPNEFSNKNDSSATPRINNPEKVLFLHWVLLDPDISLLLQDMFIYSLQKEKPDAYDMLVIQMGLEMRARPSDRTKTPEEIAQEERERLERLEVWCMILKSKNNDGSYEVIISNV